MAAYATVADYEERTAQALTGAARAQVAALLAEACGLMRAAAVDLDDRLAAGTVEEALLTGIAVRIVVRYLANPTHATSLTTGPFSASWSGGGGPRGLYLSDDELALIVDLPSGPGARVGTVRVGLPVGTVQRGPYRRPR